MRWFIALAVVIVLMFVGGWLYYRDTGNTAEIILDKQQVREDVHKAINAGEAAIEKATEKLESSKAPSTEQPAERVVRPGAVDEVAPKAAPAENRAKEPAIGEKTAEKPPANRL